MLIKNLEYEVISRFTQANDYMDVEVDMLSTSAAVTSGQDFAVEFVHNILLGLTTLTNPGYSAKFIDSDDTEFTSIIAEADFYETETHLISESTIINSIPVSADMFIRSAQILFNRGGGQEPLTVLTSAQPGLSSLAEEIEPGSADKGLKIALAGGNLTITTIFRFTVVK